MSTQTFASRTSSHAQPLEVQAVKAGIAKRMSWPSMHWGVEDVHPDAWPHIAAAALDAALTLGAIEWGYRDDRLPRDVIGPISEGQAREAVAAIADLTLVSRVVHTSEWVAA